MNPQPEPRMSSDLGSAAGEGLVDHSVFDQLLEMDDDDEREFSKSIVWNFFEQAEQTFTQIEDAL